eukprot:6348301-Amphidinium_carterae.1
MKTVTVIINNFTNFLNKFNPKLYLSEELRYVCNVFRCNASVGGPHALNRGVLRFSMVISLANMGRMACKSGQAMGSFQTCLLYTSPSPRDRG